MRRATGGDPRRLIPSVDQLLQRRDVQALAERHGRPVLLRHLRALLDETREEATASADGGPPDADALATALAGRLDDARRPSLVRVINATGVIVHTNLGRAPLSPEAAARVAEIAASYSNLEYDLSRGERGDREVHAESRLRHLLGVEATAVVNNCAAAVLLAVNTLADGREVLVSRGELVEIGGSFRIPDVIRKGGARLVEVGTTNRTRLGDYRAALGPETALILKVHASNFRIVGFTESPPLEDLAALARSAGVALALDQGSGLLDVLPGALASEATAARALTGGADVVTFSGDKLLGGPQAGLVAGRRAYVEPMRRNPLYRALRVDKMTLAALDAVLAEHEAGRAAGNVPVLRMIHAPLAEVRSRAQVFAEALVKQDAGLAVEVRESDAAVGGGAAPTVGLPSAVVALAHRRVGADRLAALLRGGTHPVIARVAEDQLLVDLRTVRPEEEATLLQAITAAARGASA